MEEIKIGDQVVVKTDLNYCGEVVDMEASCSDPFSHVTYTVKLEDGSKKRVYNGTTFETDIIRKIINNSVEPVVKKDVVINVTSPIGFEL